MNFHTFQQTFSAYPVFSIRDIELYFRQFDRSNLVNWQQKGYLTRVRNGWYLLNGQPKSQEILAFISNQIYRPSYLSLEMALSHYGFIPEGVFQYTGITTLKTNQFDTPLGRFTYRNLKPALFFGYTLVPFGSFRYNLATPEKALLDYLYLHPDITTQSHFHGLRLNAREIKSQINQNVLLDYCACFGSKALSKRCDALLQYLLSQSILL